MSTEKFEIGQVDKILGYLLYIAPASVRDYSCVCFRSHGTIMW